MKVFSSKLFQGTAFIFASNVVSKVIGFILIALIAKYLDIEEYGKITLILAIMTTVAELVSSGLNSSLVRYSAKYVSENNHKKLDALLSTSFVNIFLIGSILAAVVFLSSSLISEFLLSSNKYSFYIEITSLGILFSLISGIYSSLFLGVQNYLNYFIYSLFSQLIRLSLFFVVINFFEDGLISIIILFTVTPLISFVFGYVLEKDIKLNIFKYDFKILVEIFSFGKWVFLWGIVAVAQSKMDIYLLAYLANVKEVAIFDIAQKFILVIMMIFGAYGAALNPRMAGLSTKNEIEREVYSTYKIVGLLSIFLILMFFLMPLVINFIFENKYNDSIVPFKIMILSLVFYILSLPFNSSMYALGKSQTFFYSALICMVVNSFSSLYFIPLYGAIGASISYFIVNILSVLTAYLMYKYYITKEIR